MTLKNFKQEDLQFFLDQGLWAGSLGKTSFDVELSWQQFDPDVPQLWGFLPGGRALGCKGFSIMCTFGGC